MDEEYVFTFGDFIGKKLSDISEERLDKYLEWIEGLDNPSPQLEYVRLRIKEHLKDWEPEDDEVDCDYNSW